ncbi:MAG: DUF1003 domain-containing protein [Amaricoccus sp.]|uniref:DUF1003 domain-containing protein n=1 Tax=Amaricoccus sp. TaxID=1872485 RepID=UPI0039E6BB04
MAERQEGLAQVLFGKQIHALAEAEAAVLRKIDRQEPISQDANRVIAAQASLGDRLADKVASVGGSWGFIASFSVILLGWMVLNSDVLGRWGIAFDPYPYIFLNLMLSTLAAIQAPVIMMSQNRQADKDRLAAQLDYQVNLRTEIEILRIQAKLDDAILTRLDQILDRLEPRAED